MRRPFLVSNTKTANEAGNETELVETPKRIILGTGRVIPFQVVEFVIQQARDLLAGGHGSRLIERLRLKIVGLNAAELTELIWLQAVAVETENAALRTAIVSHAAMAIEARHAVWQDRAA